MSQDSKLARRTGSRRIRSLQHPPLALQAREAILAAILDGRFETRLPREEDLAAMLKVSRTTVRAAVQDLERDGDGLQPARRLRGAGAAAARAVRVAAAQEGP